MGADRETNPRVSNRRKDQWTVAPFWGVHRPQRHQQQHEGEPGPSSRQLQHEHFPMEEGKIGSETDQDPSVLEVPAVERAKYVGVKSVKYMKIGHALKVDTEEPNDWDLKNAVPETGKIFNRLTAAHDGNNR